MRSIREQRSAQQWLEEYINTPIKISTYEEATANLQRLGVLDKEGNIIPEYEDIIIKK